MELKRCLYFDFCWVFVVEHNQLAEDFHQPGNIEFEAANYTDASCNYNRNLEYDKSNLEVYGNRDAACELFHRLVRFQC